MAEYEEELSGAGEERSKSRLGHGDEEEEREEDLDTTWGGREGGPRGRSIKMARQRGEDAPTSTALHQ